MNRIIMLKNIIKAAPDYLPLTFRDFIRHFSNLLTTNQFDLWIPYKNYTKILGYACRALFETCMMYYQKDDLVVATTPLNHRSFRNIIEKYVKPENVHIIELNKQFNGIKKMPELDQCDLVLITHLFGQDMDLANLTDLAEFKKKHKCVVIEDRVQGGSLDLKFSNDLIDISLYSMAMDKRPVALGGGYMLIKNSQKDLITTAIKMVENLPLETTRSRFKEFLKKIPTFLLYNSRSILFFFICVLDFLSHFNSRINVLNITKSYRKSNPGFSHFNFMQKPSPGLCQSMYENFHNYRKMERLYANKFTSFINQFSPRLQSYFFPWYRGENSLTPYNTILIEEDLVPRFLSYFNTHNISTIPNPTYKIFNPPYENDIRVTKFNNEIIYLPSLANMNKEEIIYLSIMIKQFFLIFVAGRKRGIQKEK